MWIFRKGIMKLACRNIGKTFQRNWTQAVIFKDKYSYLNVGGYRHSTAFQCLLDIIQNIVPVFQSN